MANFSIAPSHLKGSLKLPPSKSHTLRAILFASLAQGTSIIKNYLNSPDTYSMIEAVTLLGAKVNVQKDSLLIEGFDGKPKVPDDVIQCGNSGLVLRLIGGLAGLIPGYTLLTGDDSIRHNRPSKPLLSALSELGCFASSSREDGYAPLILKGPFTKNEAFIDGEDSQPVSALLIASSFHQSPITLHVKDPGEKPWINLTLDWFKRLGISYEMKDYTFYKMEGNSRIKGFTYEVPGDLSAAAFPIAASLLTGSEIFIENVDLNDIQGDKLLFSYLQEMGAKIHVEENSKSIRIEKTPFLMGKTFDLNACIDALPILSVIACFAKSPTEIINASIARKKESDRIACITKELRKMGALIEEKEDGLIIHPSDLQGTTLYSHLDHRIALSLSIAAFSANGKSYIQNIDCIDKSYPGFYEEFKNIGALIEVL